jgi:hypothetical protein
MITAFKKMNDTTSSHYDANPNDSSGELSTMRRSIVILRKVGCCHTYNSAKPGSFLYIFGKTFCIAIARSRDVVALSR